MHEYFAGAVFGFWAFGFKIPARGRGGGGLSLSPEGGMHGWRVNETLHDVHDVLLTLCPTLTFATTYCMFSAEDKIKRLIGYTYCP